MSDARKGIAVAGNLIVDYYKEIDRYPDQSTLTSIRSIETETGGLACNVALALSRIDNSLPIPVLGRIGHDESGDFIMDRLHQAGNIDTSLIVREGQTSFTDVMIDLRDRTRTFFQFRGANDDFCEADVPLDSLSCRLLHIGYLLLLEHLDSPDPVYGTNMAKLLAAARKRGIQTSIDVVSEHSARFSSIVPPALRYVDYCIVNDYESEMITGIPLRDDKGMLQVGQAEKICREFFALGVSTWVVIHAREGAVALNREGEFITVPARSLAGHQVVNPTGAGDAFAAGVLTGAHKGYSLEKSVSLGIASAAMSLLAFSAYGSIGHETALERFFSETPPESWPGFTTKQGSHD